MTEKEKKQNAWDFAIGLIKVDGLEPTEDFKRLIEREVRREITKEEMRQYLNQKYTAVGEKQND